MKRRLAFLGASLSYTYALIPGLWVLMLDVNTMDAAGAVKDATLQWARRQLEAARRAGVQVLAVSHQNLLAHNSLFSYGYVIEGGERLLALYEEFGVLCNLSGHMHIPHISEARQFFWDVSYAKAAEALSDAYDALCTFFADVNAAYFAGHVEPDLWEETLYDEICGRETFLGVYLQSIRDDGFWDHTQRTFMTG